jgi:hypothetical protein
MATTRAIKDHPRTSINHLLPFHRRDRKNKRRKACRESIKVLATSLIDVAVRI